MDEIAATSMECFSSNLYAATLGLWSRSYSCVSFEVFRTLPLVAAQRGLSFISCSLNAVLKEMSTELLEQTWQLDGLEVLSIVSDIWHDGFIERIQQFLAVVNLNVESDLRKLFVSFIHSDDLEFSRKLVGVVLLGRADDRCILRRVVDMLISLGDDIYLNLFEKPLLDACELYLRDEILRFSMEEFCHLIADRLENWSYFMPSNSLNDILKEMFTELLKRTLQLDDSEMLLIISDVWHSGFIERIQQFFAVKWNMESDLGKLFVSFILSPDLLFSRKLLDAVFLRRADDQYILKRVVDMLISLGKEIYLKVFEKPFLDACELYFHDAVLRYSVEEFCHLIAGRVENWSNFMPREPQLELSNLLRVILWDSISDMLVTHLLTGGSDDTNDSLETISTVYQYFSRSIAGSLIIWPWFSCCFDNCFSNFPQYPSDSTSSAQLIEEIISVADNCKEMIESYLGSNSVLFHYLDCSIANLINGNKRYAECISLFADVKLREDPESCTVHKIIALIELLHDKDAFKDYYLKHLARRVVYEESSLEAESQMISKLNKALGDTKLVSDSDALVCHAQKSAEIMKGFQMSQASHDPSISVQVFDSTTWPLSHKTCQLPSELLQERQDFTAYYKSRAGHSNRSLQWLSNFGSAIIEGQFDSGVHEFKVTTSEMCIMMLFNSSSLLSFDEIQKATGMLTCDLLDSLKSLWKKKLLLCDVRNDIPCFSVNDSFSLDHALSSSVHTESFKEPEPEFVETIAKLGANRRYPIEAAIVFLMKFHKRLNHTELVAAVVEKLRKYFLCEAAQIKERIESLIGRDYLERDSDDSQVYHYID